MATTTTYLDIENGRPTRQTAAQTSAGVGDANKLVRLGTDGYLDKSLFPAGGQEVKTVVADTGGLSAGDFVNLYNSSGTLKARKADATTSGKEAHGWVDSAVSAGANATVYFSGGLNTNLTSLTVGSSYYLATTAGGVTATPPSSTGNVQQFIGVATSTTELLVDIQQLNACVVM